MPQHMTRHFHMLTSRGLPLSVSYTPLLCPDVSILVRTQLRASPLPAHRPVFMQYLAGLAIVRMLGAEAGARVWLKWPNDVYIWRQHQEQHLVQRRSQGQQHL